MKQIIKSLSVVFLFLTLAQSVNASLLLEPYVGYMSGTIKQNSSSNVTGTDFGARIGYSTMIGLAFGAEYEGASLTDDASIKSTYTIGDLGAFISFKFPVLFRVYGTFVPSSTVKGSSNISFNLNKGTSTKLGLGFTGLPFININLEYYTSSYTEFEALGIKSTLSPSSTSSTIGLGVSAPFYF